MPRLAATAAQIVALVLGLPSALYPQVTVRDVFDGFHQNRQRFLVPGFRVESDRHITDGNRIQLRQSHRQVLLRLQTQGLQEQEKAELETKLRRIETELQSSAPNGPRSLSYRCKFWVQGSAMQVEAGSLTGESVPGYEFVDVPVTSDNLSTAYSTAHVRWFSGEPTDGVFGWLGQSRNGVFQAGLNSPAEMTDDALGFPPFVVNDYWPVSQSHAIDLFYSGPENIYEMAERQPDQPGPMIVIERKAQLRPESFLGPTQREKWASRLKGVEVQSALIDVSRGCVPIRIEWRNRWEMDGMPFAGGGDFDKIIRRVRDVQVEEIDGVGFYPTSGTIEIMTRDPSFDGRRMSLGEVLERGGEPAPDIPLLVLQTTSWTCSKIARLTFDPQFAKAAFPAGTAYFDTRAGRTLYVGDERALLNQMTKRVLPATEQLATPAAQPISKQLISRWWLLALNVAIMLAIVASVLRRTVLKRKHR